MIQTPSCWMRLLDQEQQAKQSCRLTHAMGEIANAFFFRSGRIRVRDPISHKKSRDVGSNEFLPGTQITISQPQPLSKAGDTASSASALSFPAAGLPKFFSVASPQ